jgi:hypothetical protein
MSSSLFYDCYAPCEDYNYPETKYVDGDKKFEEIKKDDILYFLKGNNMLQIKVKIQWHIAKGYCYITLIDHKIKNINFGSCRNANALDSKFKSVVYYNGYIIGTNKDTVIKMAIKRSNERIINIDKEIKRLSNSRITETKELEKLKKAYL